MLDKATLERLYQRYNRPELIHPDPLEFVLRYRRLGDREIAGLVASSLAYGRVAQILRSVSFVLDAMAPSPLGFVAANSYASMRRLFSGFKHRFADARDISALLSCAGRAVSVHGSLNAAFLAGFENKFETVLPALASFVAQFDCAGEHLLPMPARGSACKRLNLYLRWMVRKDLVDPGGWRGIPASKLIVPLDTHMARIGIAHGMTERKSPSMRMALDITGFFRRFGPDDPVRYDFALTRFGIRSDMDMAELAV